MNLEISLEDLLKNGSHFCHNKKIWNPKMEKYIYGEKNGTHILDLRNSLPLIEIALKFALDSAKNNFKALTEDKPFKKCYDYVAETFRSKPTGNRVLGFVCSYCPYKLPCWGRDKLQLLPQQQSKGKNPKWVWYTSVTNPKEETNEYGGD